jgi:small subunit ribosomal protein S20
MPIIKSAKKRVRVSNKAAIRNSKVKRSLKSAVKSFNTSLKGDKKKSAAALSKAQSELAKAGKKKIIHKNKVARKQRQLARAAKAAAGTAKPTITKKTVAAKKTTTKKAAVKK